MATEDQCIACGERNPAGSAFCVFCGSYLGWDETGGGPGPAARPTAAATPPPPPVPVEPSSAGAPLSAPPPRPPASTTPVGTPCPQCGQDNPVARRFCSRCGQQLAAATAVPSARVPRPSERRSWWRSEDRAAKRDYRRSLPAFYRWRRVALGVLAVAVVVVLAFVLGRDPVGWVKDRWYDVRGTTEPVPGVKARATQPGSTEPVTEDEVIDGNPATTWARMWSARSDPTSDCDEAERQGYVELSWRTPVRVRMLQVDAGLADEKMRDLEYRPRTILVSYRSGASSGRSCWHGQVPDTAARTDLEIDTGDEVTSLRVSVGSVFDPTTPDRQDPVSIRELVVRSRPQ